MTTYRVLHIGVPMLIVGVASAAACFFALQGLYFCVFFAGLAIVFAVAYVTHICTVDTRRMQRMVEAVRHADFSLRFLTKGQSPSQRLLVEEINVVLQDFRQRLSFLEERYQFFSVLLDTVDTSVIVVDTEDNVLYMNRSAEHELCGHTLHTLGELAPLNPHFPAFVSNLSPGEPKVIRIYRGEAMHDLAVTVSVYTSRDVTLRVVSLKNIRSLLDENETEAWQKLVRVLTHEIMNSITPIISLSDTLRDRLATQGDGADVLVLKGMETIHRRSRGLLTFVENYRKLSRLAQPVLQPVRVGDWIDDIRRMYTSSSVRYIYKVEDADAQLMIDRSQMEQVLINLLKNAAEACEGQPCPEVIIETAVDSLSRVFSLSVTDNGIGILPEVLDKIFIPFFTTKPSGSGIGLSLCKQILTLHGGSIRATSTVGVGSTFTVKLAAG